MGEVKYVNLLSNESSNRLIQPLQSDGKGNKYKVSKCKLKKYLFGDKTKESRMNFAIS